MRSGVRLACDVGSVRIGIARSDATGMLAVPLDAVAAGDDSVEAVRALVAEWEAIEVVVGLPLHLSGQEGPSSAARLRASSRSRSAMSLPRTSFTTLPCLL